MSPGADQSQPANNAPDPSVSDQIEQLQEQISRAQQTIRQIQNVTGTGIGSTTPARTKGGITIPPVSALRASVPGNTAGESQLYVQWIDAATPVGASIDHYNVYVIQSIAGQSQPTLVGGSKQSPFVGIYQPSGANATTVAVQTVLSNGQTLPLVQCPTTSIVGVSPGSSVLQYLLGFYPQITANVLAQGANTSVVVIASGSTPNGGILSVVGFSGLAGSGSLSIRLGIDGVVTSTLVANAASFSQNVQNVGFRSSATSTLLYYGLGFQNQMQVSITCSGDPNTQSNVSVQYALHT